jgi:hypothetical protein
MAEVTHQRNFEKLKQKTMKELDYIMDKYNLHPEILPIWEEGSIEDYNNEYKNFCCIYLSKRILLK